MDMEKLQSQIRKQEEEKYDDLNKIYKNKINNYGIKPSSKTFTYHCRATLIICCHGPK